MKQLIDLIIRFKDYIALTMLCIISLSFISMGDVSKIGGYRAFVVGVVGWMEEAFSWVPNPEALKTENQTIRELNLYLSSELMKSRTAMSENEKLKEMLEFKEAEESPLISSNVVGKATIELRRFITLDRGSEDSIKVGMAVRTDAGLVGSVTLTEDNYSLVETLENRHVKVSVKIVRNGITGILKWSGEKYFLMQNIPKSFDVQKGDEIVTSNYSRKYPVNIPVGKVIKVEDDVSSLFSKVFIKPYASFNTLEQVFIIKDVTDPERIKLIEEMERKLSLRKQ